MQIHFLKHNEIDLIKWDESIESSRNGLVYALSWFLDAVSPGWEALVSDDYQYIMPLPVKSKFGIKYLVQPILTQQLGVFSQLPIDSNIVNLFIRKIPYWSYELNLNEINSTSKGIESPNYTLDLQYESDFLKSNFSKNTLRNITNAQKNDLLIDKKISVDEFLNFYYHEELNYPKPNESITRQLIQTLDEKQVLAIWGCRLGNSELISAVCIVKWNNRITYLLPISSAEGKSQSAMFLIINALIEKFSNTEALLDFEGSRIEGIVRFYKGFGAKNTPYYIIRKLRPGTLVNFINRK